jgi:branched-chain amino acid aminotransferase
VAVTEIDFRKIGNGRMGPITRKLQQAFHSLVRGEHPRSAEWLESVD